MSNTASDQFVGRPVPRVEDRPLIRGEGQYVSDFHDKDQWVMAVVRSTHAHARILHVKTHEAETLPGVHGVFTAKTVSDFARPMPGEPAPAQSPLALDHVRYVGEPIAVVLADTRYLAEDAAERVRVDYEALPPVISVEKSLAGDVLLHPEMGKNEADHVHIEVGDGLDAFETVDVVIEETLSMGRVSGQPMEPRAIFSRYQADTPALEVFYATQSVHRAKERISEFLAIDPQHVRVVAPDVGGGFGVKNGAYPEEFLVTWLSWHLKRTIKWNGDRFEEFLSTAQEREQVHHAKLGLTKDGKIVALSDVYYQDNGGYPGRGFIPFRTTAGNLVGPYVIPHVFIDGSLMLTNKVPQAPYRGAGRPQGHYVIERLLDHAADRIGMDRAEIRKMNLYDPTRNASRPTYDSGNYPASFQMLLDHIHYDQWRQEQASQQTAGEYLGLGIANYVEVSGGRDFEGAKFTLLRDGHIEVATGASSQGQGHRTALAQIVADALSVPFEQVLIREGDTGAIERGVGTFGSRSMIMAGNAAATGATIFMKALKEVAALKLEAHTEDMVMEDGRLFVRGVPSVALSLEDVAHHLQSQNRAPLTHAEYYQTTQATYGFGSHALWVSVNPSRASVRILDYVIVHDGGRIINPLLADGQVVGGTIQGLGTALFEEMVFDEAGQPLTTTFMDYLLPGAVESPDVTILHANFPAPHNPAGFKGIGEAGIIPSQALVLSAVENALTPFGVKLTHAPVTPKRLFESLPEEALR